MTFFVLLNGPGFHLDFLCSFVEIGIKKFNCCLCYAVVKSAHWLLKNVFIYYFCSFTYYFCSFTIFLSYLLSFI